LLVDVRPRSLKPVGVASEGDDFGVVDEPVDHGGGDNPVSENSAPANWVGTASASGSSCDAAIHSGCVIRSSDVDVP
jgi:hypothetical protein